MNFACKILASLLLISIPSTKGVALKTYEVLGALHHDGYVNVIDLPERDVIDDIVWKKGKRRIVSYSNRTTATKRGKYEVFQNGTLKIEHLEINDSDNYQVDIYDADGWNILKQIYILKILEKVSKPVINWNCTNTTMTCEITQGTDPKLTLYRSRIKVREGQMAITYKWTTKRKTRFNCTATNPVSVETSVVDIDCTEKGLDIPLIIGICGGGVFFLLFVALLVLFISKRRKQNRRKRDKKLELRAHRNTSEERSQRPYKHPASTPPSAAASLAPPPPGYRPQAHGPRPPPAPGHLAPPQPQKRPLPSPGYQQKGPPLPTPRAQQKPPRGGREKAKLSPGRADPVALSKR